jgi:TRAP-type C4-dicarboxylate transport system permease large subunit
MMQTIKGAMPFVIVMLLFIVLLTAFPSMATYLPSHM